MRLLWLRAVEAAVYAAWGLTGYRPGRLSSWHYKSESRLRREEYGL